jgi:hypothetical protein
MTSKAERCEHLPNGGSMSVLENTEIKRRTALRPELSARQSAQVHALAGYSGVSASDFVRACIDAMIMTAYQGDPVAAGLLEAINEMN